MQWSMKSLIIFFLVHFSNDTLTYFSFRLRGVELAESDGGEETGEVEEESSRNRLSTRLQRTDT